MMIPYSEFREWLEAKYKASEDKRTNLFVDNKALVRIQAETRTYLEVLNKLKEVQE